tara:strand:+ start:4420 stop:4833 length:414 start_codon:yes stop_codon:yes gene_type:complete
MATTTVLSNPGLVINSVSYTDQCTSCVVTLVNESLESTSFADAARTYTAGLENNEITAELMLAYGSSEVEELLTAIQGTQTTVTVFATNTETASASNPSYTLTNTYLESFTPINGSLGELQTVSLVFTGGAATRAVS